MARQATQRLPRTIDRVAFDSFLYAVAKSLGHLGEDSKSLEDAIGGLMLGYLIDSGAVKHPEKPEQFARSLRSLLTKNGFGPEVPLRFEGSPPSPSVDNFVGYLMGKTGAAGRTAGGRRRKGPGKRGRVDWVLYEMALYGVTKALDDQLGAQAQLILDRVGGEMVKYLLEAKVVKESDDPEVFFLRIKDYFVKGGFAKDSDFRIEGNPPRALVATWTYARYYTNVLRRLRNEGCALFSCPVCLMGDSILARTQGLKFQNLVELKFLPRAKVYYRHRVIPPRESFTEEDAERIAELKV